MTVPHDERPRIAPSPAARRARLPGTTLVLLGIVVATTAVEFALARSTDPSPGMLMALGGMSSSAVRAGEWYRLVTAALLHGGILHLVLNGVAMLFGGAVVESLVDRAWLPAIALVSAVTGSLLGTAVNDPSIVSVGASGSIMGILAAGAVLAFRLPSGPERTQLLTTLARFLIPSLLPLATTSSGGRIDYAAHIGGALGGAAMGGLLLAGRLADRSTWAKIAAFLSVSFVAASVGAEVKQYPELAAEASLDAESLLVPDGTIPSDPATAARTVDAWGKNRPRDPRVHLFRAARILDDGGSPKDAEAELRAALAEKGILRKFFPDRKLETAIRGLLASALIQEGRAEDARREARPVCDAGEGGSVPPVLRDLDVCPR
jgi:rhomboid protease GluP